MGKGFTIGALREELLEIEESITSTESLSEEEYEKRKIEATASCIHVFGAALIQVAQELNELKHQLERLVDSAERQTEDTKPFIH
jgi:hypothetical protein